MALDDIIQVNIVTESPGVSQAGFGIPLLLGYRATFAERVRFYNNLSAVQSDFSETDPEFVAARAIFSQNPTPRQIAIGRGENVPTQTFNVSVSSVRSNTEYSLFVNDSLVSIVSDGTADNDEIIIALETAINGLAGAGVTATAIGSVGSETLNIVANNPGEFHGISVNNPDLLSLSQTHADPGVSADLTAITLENSTWYALITLFNSRAYILAAAAFAESNEKLYIAASSDTEMIATSFSSASDVAKQLSDLGRARTALMYHDKNNQFADAAWAGRILPFLPGSVTWAFKTLSGVVPVSLSGTHKVNLRAKNANFYEQVAGVNVTQVAKVSANEFIDVVRFRDWLKARLQERIFGVLSTVNKVPFTDAGIAVIQNEVQAQLDEGIDTGGIALDPPPTVTVPLVADVSQADKAARILRNVNFSATLAGAIHEIQINGTISV